ncbi:MAG: hypothetical protein IJW51_01685 [Clostridia bacterium]|nr:hypothetical protein [Clostridia bacterium]
MEKLHILPNKQLRAVRRGGNEVLLLRLPLVTGDTPAARHVAAMIEALATHAEARLADAAAEALALAIKNRDLPSFSRYRYEVFLTGKHRSRGDTFTLCACLYTAAGAFPSHTLTMTWNNAQTLQKKAALHRPAARRG